MRDMTRSSELRVLRCADCGQLDPGPREYCAACGSDRMTEDSIGGRGTLVSWTVIRRPPKSFRTSGPYAIVVVKLDSEISITGRMEEFSERLEPGLPVEFSRMQDSYHLFKEQTS
jgi:uncharacterized OB-fold protein